MPSKPHPVPDCRKPYYDPKLDCWRLPVNGGVEVLIDAADVPLVSGHLWSWTGLQVHRMDQRHDVQLCRLITGATAGQQVIHLNDDPLDYRWQNLVATNRRRVSHRFHKQRACRGRPTTSKYKGVTWDSARKIWKAEIMCPSGRLRKFLGRYQDELAAARAYDEAALKHFGRFARLNLRPNGPIPPAAA
jgi:predicted protein tyrosine phosphatase